MITIHTFKTEHGTLGRNGALGFRDYIVSLDPKYKDWETLGILCDSEIGLHCNEPILLCGGLNGTSYFNNRSPRVRFYIDEIPFGEAEHPWQMTDRIVLTKGYHVLRTRLIDPVADIVTDFWIDHSRETLAHTVWAFRDVDCGRQIIADKNNTLFVSAAAFGAETPEQTKLFRESAAAQKIPLELYDIDQEFMTFFEHKIKNFLTHLIEWKNRGVEYIFSLDSRDIVFRHPVEIILGKFNALLEKGKILIAKDLGGVVHPFFYHWLAGELQKIVGKDYEINTGVIAGHVDDLINVYTGIITLREEFLSGVARTELLARLFKYAKEHPSHNRRFDIDNDDQALHFVNMMVYPEWYQLDSNKVLSAFIADFPSNPRLCDQPDKRDAICSASILHGSRPASRGHWETMCRKHWWEEDENKRQEIPIQIPALELNVTYSCNLQCEYCAHLGRYIKGIVPVDAIACWLDSWKDKVLPCIVRILGGEPCLHQDLSQIIRMVHDAWPMTKRVLITNGLIERADEYFLYAMKETGTDIWVSVHYDSQKMHEVISKNVALWQAAGITVAKNRYSREWRKCYRLENGKPIPFNTNPKTAYDHCCQKRHCMTLLDNQLFMCPPAALFQYAHAHHFVGAEWKLAADYKPLPPTCTRRELSEFVENTHEKAICSMCPDQWVNAAPYEKANLQGLADKQYLADLLQNVRKTK